MNSSKKAPDFKVIVVGDTAVGKTSIILRFQHDVFLPEHQATVGASFITKTVETPNGPANLNLWDTAGQERYRSLVPMYSRGAAVALIVFDVSEKSSFNELPNWVAAVRQDAPDDCQLFIVGNKLDLEFAMPKEEIISWAAKNKVQCFFVSALTGDGIQELFKDVSQRLPRARFGPTVQDLSVPTQTQTSGGCC